MENRISRQRLPDGMTSLRRVLLPCAIAILLTGVWTALRLDAGVSLRDEGFLWYGVQRVALGDAPLVDFQGYGPFRYYAAAFISDGYGGSSLQGMRVAIGFFQALGVVGALLVLLRDETNRVATAIQAALISATLLVWYFPGHKAFDITASIMLVAAFAALVERPNTRRWFITGLVVGFVAVIGRNHGVYGLVASALIFFWMIIRQETRVGLIRAIFPWGLGIAIGFAPLVGMALLIPGMLDAYLEAILWNVETGQTNLQRPVPWPWRLDMSLPTKRVVQGFVLGGFFALYTLGLVLTAWVFVRRWRDNSLPPVLVACAVVLVPYAHHAFSRADLSHLATAIFPWLIAVLFLLRRSLPGLVALLLLSGYLLIYRHPGSACTFRAPCVTIEIEGVAHRPGRRVAREIELIKAIDARFNPEGAPFLATMPGAYAALEREAPVWEIYPLFPRSADFEAAEIERLKDANPAFAVIWTRALDGNDALRYAQSHPLTYAYITDNYVPLDMEVPARLEVFVRKDLIQ